MEQRLIGEHQRDHRLHHRHPADADARVVPAARHDLARLAVAGDRFHRGEDRAGRLERDAQAQRLAGRNAPRDPAGMISEEARAAIACFSQLKAELTRE